MVKTNTISSIKKALAKSSFVQNNTGRETEEKERNHSIFQFGIYFSSSNGKLGPQGVRWSR